MKRISVEGSSPFVWSPDKGSSPQLKKPRLELIKQDIPLIKNLHPSFWEDRHFLGWQLMRLDKNYQKNVDILW